MLRRASRLALGAVLVLAAPLGVGALTRRLADAWGVEGGRALAAWAALLPVRSAEPAVETARETPPLAAPEPAVERALAAAPRRRSTKTSQQPSRRGVLVSAPAVLALARTGSVPQAVPVPASGARPAGLRLLGVAALGIGLRDGDVLVRVAGAPATSVAAVADLVLRARAARAPRISAEFWRDGVPWSLVVEQPYPKSPESG